MGSPTGGLWKLLKKPEPPWLLSPPGFLMDSQPATRFPGPLQLHLAITAEGVTPTPGAMVSGQSH